MIATDRVLFLHLHKSGGTFVNALLLRCVPSARHIGYHLPYREVPALYRSLPVLGTVRNPWDYYVSWYHFQATRPKPNILYRLCSNGGTLGFEETVANLVNLAADEPRLAVLEKQLPETYGISGLNLTRGCMGELRKRGGGFYSFLYERLYAGAEAPTIMRCEQLRDELRHALSKFGHRNESADRFIDESPTLNASEHGPSASYYSPSLAALIAQRDRELIERFGYELG